MKLQSKITIGLLPLILMSFLSLGLWSVKTAAEGIRALQYEHLNFLVDTFFKEELEKANKVLTQNGLSTVNSFVEDYQKAIILNTTKRFVGEKQQITIFDNSGNVVFCSNPLYNNEDFHSQLRPLLQKTTSNSGTSLQGHVDNGAEHFNFSARLFPPWRWHVFITTSDEQVHQSISQLKKAAFGIATLLAVCCSLLILLLFKFFLVRPINQLKIISQSIANRQKIESFGSPSNDELGDLAQSIHIMSKDVYAYQESLAAGKEVLEKKIQERTTELEQEKQLAQKYLDVAGVMLVALDTTGRISMINQKGCQLLEVTEEDVLGKNWFEHFVPEQHTSEATIVFNKLMSGDLSFVENYENPVVTSKGQILKIAFHNTPLKSNMGEIVGILFSGEDITERKRAEEEKQALDQQIQHTQKLESLGVLSGGIAHDFNNILAAIIGYCGLTKLNFETAEKNIPEIEKAAERAAGLCRQMMAYAGKAQLTKAQVNMVTKVDGIVGMLKSTLPQNAVIKTDLSAEIPLIEGDASQLRQVVMNLIINASEAIGAKQGEVNVSLARIKVKPHKSYEDYHGKAIPPGEYVCLEVTDNGCGMDEATKWRIFEPFYTTKFTGRGLGMSAVLGIIKSHAGTLQLFSQPGQGTTFKVYLPALTSETDRDEVQAVAVPATPWQGSGTILLAEDEAQVRYIAKEMLQMFGFTVLEAVNGKEALEIYLKNTAVITLVVTDMGMPVMDGYELIHQLKILNPELPIIVSSGYGDADVTSRIGSDNIAGIINKPYNMNKLQEVLKSAVEGTASTKA